MSRSTSEQLPSPWTLVWEQMASLYKHRCYSQQFEMRVNGGEECRRQPNVLFYWWPTQRHVYFAMLYNTWYREKQGGQLLYGPGFCEDWGQGLESLDTPGKIWNVL